MQWFGLNQLSLNVLADGTHLGKRKKKAAFAPWGEHPMPDASSNRSSTASKDGCRRSSWFGEKN